MNHSILCRYARPATVLALCFLSAPSLAQSITVVSWGGSYARVSQEAYHKPFTEETGIEIRLEDYNGGLAQIRAQVESGTVYWDVVDLELADAVRGCDEGLFELIDYADLPPGADGSGPEEDYYPDTVSECGAGTLFYSTVYAYNSEVISGETPGTIDDFFDLERFSGRRGMRRSPLVNLEFALMADGVAIEDVYAVMDTDEGLARAFRKLDTIKDQIVWDGQVLDSGPMGIVAGTPRLAEALQFVQFVARPASMARISQYIAYSPARRSAEALISTHLETGVDMLPHMPNTPEHTQRALRNDWAWWSDNGDEMNERFIVWLSQ